MKADPEQRIDHDTAAILDLLYTTRGYDFRGCSPAMLDRRITRRCAATGTADKRSYRAYLSTHPEEVHELLDVLTIQVSCFFREPLLFDYIGKVLLPELVRAAAGRTLHVWSAGCAFGEEAYSIAILLREAALAQKLDIPAQIIATDLNERSLDKAKQARYPSEQLSQVRLGFVKKYFREQDGQFVVHDDIRSMVRFEPFDLLDLHQTMPLPTEVPRYDLVLCCNVLIFFNAAYQELMVDKLYGALGPRGYLVLGETEAVPARFEGLLQKKTDLCRVYQKIK